jgi:hypothetical protein
VQLGQISLVCKLSSKQMLVNQIRGRQEATNASSSNFGYQVRNKCTSITMVSAGFNATDASNSNFIGFNAGLAATSAQFSISLVRLLCSVLMLKIQIS